MKSRRIEAGAQRRSLYGMEVPGNVPLRKSLITAGLVVWTLLVGSCEVPPFAVPIPMLVLS